MDGQHPPQHHALRSAPASSKISSATFHSPYVLAPSSKHGETFPGESYPRWDHSAGVQPVRRWMKTLMNFVWDTGPQLERIGFEVDDSRPDILQLNFAPESKSPQQVYMKKGSCIAFKGEINFKSGVEQGKKVISAGGFVEATSKGKAQLYLADCNKLVTVLQLKHGEKITVSGDNILAFEHSLEYKIVMMSELCQTFSASLFVVTLWGEGCVAIVSRGKPLTLVIQPGESVVRTNFEATVAWSSHLTPGFEPTGRWIDIFGQRSGGRGKGMVMMFCPKKGEGYVVVEPYEE